MTNDLPKDIPNKLNIDDSFTFSCHNKLSCFNDCCHDVNIVLTPYDILRLKNRLKISSEEFLPKYTVQPFTPDQKLPVVLFNMGTNEEKACPFLTKEGCSVYEDRPWACRMFPLGIASPSEGSGGNEFYFLLEDRKCCGQSESKTQTVEEWIKDQGIVDYDRMGRHFKNVSLHKFLLEGGELNPQKLEMFHTVCYNLDKFRRLVFETGNFLEMFVIDDAEVEMMRENDEDLLLFGFRWLRFSLYGEKVLEVSEKGKSRILDKQKQ